jgi:hypothetical protein
MLSHSLFNLVEQADPRNRRSLTATPVGRHPLTSDYATLPPHIERLRHRRKYAEGEFAEDFISAARIITAHTLSRCRDRLSHGPQRACLLPWRHADGRCRVEAGRDGWVLTLSRGGVAADDRLLDPRQLAAAHTLSAAPRSHRPARAGALRGTPSACGGVERNSKALASEGLITRSLRSLSSCAGVS